MEIQQKDNDMFAAYIHCFKKQLSDVLSTMTLQQSTSLLKALEIHPPSQLKYQKDPKTLGEGHQNSWKP